MAGVMTRIEFAHSIQNDNTSVVGIIANFFDQFNLLYNILDYTLPTKIIEASNNSIEFQVTGNTLNEADALYTKVSGIQDAVIYESHYKVYATRLDDLNILISLV